MSKLPKKPEISSAVSYVTPLPAENDETIRSGERQITIPDAVASSGSLEALVNTARDYARQATADNTNLAYKKDWAHFTSWCRRRGADPLSGEPCPNPQLIGLYIADCASPPPPAKGLAACTIERRLSGLSWNYNQRGLKLDRSDRHISSVLAGIKRKHGKPPEQKEAITAEELLEMIATLTFSLREIRDRAIILIGYAGGLRRSEIVGLDVGKDETDDSGGWIEFMPGGAVLWIKGKRGWRDVEIARGSSDASCPVKALEQWLHYSKIAHGPVFRRVYRDNSGVGSERLSDKHVSRLIKRLVLESGIGPDLPDEERLRRFSGHSLRAGLASSTELDERYVQKQLGHSSVEMTRRYQRNRDRFRVNLTKAAGL